MFSVFLFFCYYLPFERDNPLHLKKLESPSSKDDLFRVWLKLAQWFWRRRLLNDPNFYISVIISPFEEDLALYLNKLEYPSLKDNLYYV
jgi:hypothetical protein